MHISDLQILIVNQGPLPDLRHAFETLISYPHADAVTGGDAPALTDALRDLCPLLLNDRAAMPDDTVNAINSTAKESRYLGSGASYAEGAERVRAHLVHFENRFKSFATAAQQARI